MQYDLMDSHVVSPGHPKAKKWNVLFVSMINKERDFISTNTLKYRNIK